ncbi:hypothetical protein F5Y19DRAFT_488465 [Xylariaceae sp. FL1651]|nr:hypothetical protein F5Y19DRAFT_488465 [Xylariaceae sp. FL1651]
MPPSWFWMAYERGIMFLAGPWDILDVTPGIRLQKEHLEATIWEFADLEMGIDVTPKTEGCYALLIKGSMEGWVSFDQTTELSTAMNDMNLVAVAKKWRRVTRKFLSITSCLSSP